MSLSLFAIRESTEGPFLCVGYRSRDAALAALDRLRAASGEYNEHVVVETRWEDTL